MASFAWLAFAYKANHQNKKAWIWILLACSFHTIGFAFLLIFLIIDKKFSKGLIVILLTTSLVLFALRFGTRIIEMFPVLTVIDRVQTYVDMDRNANYGLTIGMVFNIGLFVLSSIIFRKEYENNTYLRVWLNALLLSIVLGLVLNVFDTIVARINQPLNMSLMFLWPYVLYRIKNRPLHFAIACLLVVYMSLYYYKSWSIEREDGQTPMLPYQIELSQMFEYQ